MSAKRRSQLTGRRLTDADVSGVASGYFDTAYNRTMAARKLALQEDALSQQQSQFAETLAQQKLSDQAQQDAAAKATKQGYINTGVQTLGTGALLKGMSGKGTEAGAAGVTDLATWGGPGSGLSSAESVGAAGQYAEGYAPSVFSPSGATVGTGAATEGTLGSTAAAETGAVGGTGAAAEGGSLVAGETAGTAAAEGGVSLGGAAAAAPYAVAGYLAAKYGGGLLKDVANKQSDTWYNRTAAAVGSSIGDKPLEDPATSLYTNLVGGEEGDTIDTLHDVASGGTSWVAKEVSKATVVCTELHRQGLIPAEVYKYDALYQVPEDVYQGYLKIASPIVAKMQKSKTFTSAVASIAIPTATEMASRVNPEIQGTKLGKLVLAVMIPVCGLVGKFFKIFDSVLCRGVS
jgi:hypothetical protein